MVLEIWGRNLAPGPPCGPAKEPYPLELCGAYVLVGSSPAELMYVSAGQINLRIPADVPADGLVPFRVCAGAVCSAPVTMQFSTHTAVLSLEHPAYVHMPVWIHVDAPSPYYVSYPCPQWPWGFRGYEFDVRRSGVSFAPIPQPSEANWAASATDRCNGATVQGSLPLHLLYRFDEPGEYSIRFTARKGTEVLYQSDWTAINIQPFSEQQRGEWLRSLEAGIKTNARNVYDVVPSLLAWPDEKALAVLLKIIPANTTSCINYDCTRLFFGKAALTAFDDALLRREIPRERLLRLCPPDGNCK